MGGNLLAFKFWLIIVFARKDHKTGMWWLSLEHSESYYTVFHLKRIIIFHFLICKILWEWKKKNRVEKVSLILEEKILWLKYNAMHAGSHQVAFVTHHDSGKEPGEWCEREGGLLAYPSWVSSGGRWEGRRAGRRRWTRCPLASGAFRSPPLTEPGSSSETEGNWCLWTVARRWAELA